MVRCRICDSWLVLVLCGLAQSLVLPPFIWVGGVTSSSCEFRVRGRVACMLRLAQSDSDVQWFELLSHISAFRAVDLEPDTVYHYSVYCSSDMETAVDATSGQFRTFPIAGQAANFSFALGSCQRTGARRHQEDPALVWASMAQLDPLAFLLHTGDLHYDDIAVGTQSDYDSAFSATLGAPHMQRFLLTTPVAYIWDDHDYGDNDADSSLETKVMARRGYHANVPHYPLLALTQPHDGGAPPSPTPSAFPANSPPSSSSPSESPSSSSPSEHPFTLVPSIGHADVDDIEIYQAFTYGRVRFLLTDLHSASHRRDADGVYGPIMGEKQMHWLLGELANASQWGMVVWVSTMAWNIDKGWGGFRPSRARVADHIAEHNVTNLLMVSGDFHGLGIDDGSNTDFSSVPGKSAGFPLIHVAPFANFGSWNTPRFSHGCWGYTNYPNNHFGVITVRDQHSDSHAAEAAPMCIDFSGFAAGRKVLNYSHCTPFTPNKHSGRSHLCVLPFLPPLLLLVYIAGIGFAVASLVLLFIVGRHVFRLWQKLFLTVLLAALPSSVLMVRIPNFPFGFVDLFIVAMVGIALVCLFGIGTCLGVNCATKQTSRLKTFPGSDTSDVRLGTVPASLKKTVVRKTVQRHPSLTTSETHTHSSLTRRTKESVSTSDTHRPSRTQDSSISTGELPRQHSSQRPATGR